MTALYTYIRDLYVSIMYLKTDLRSIIYVNLLAQKSEILTFR